MPFDPSTITTEAKLDCAKRELAMRRAVYPKRVRTGQMSRDDFEREVALMRAIVEDYTDRLRTEGGLLV